MYWSHNPHSLLDHYTFNIQFQVNMFFYFWNKSTRLVNEVAVFVVFLPDLNKVNFMKIAFSIGKLRGIFLSNIWMHLPQLWLRATWFCSNEHGLNNLWFNHLKENPTSFIKEKKAQKEVCGLTLRETFRFSTKSKHLNWINNKSKKYTSKECHI